MHVACGTLYTGYMSGKRTSLHYTFGLFRMMAGREANVTFQVSCEWGSMNFGLIHFSYQ
jgi:hypothetical protein